VAEKFYYSKEEERESVVFQENSKLERISVISQNA
jgi:hypothetical protein